MTATADQKTVNYIPIDSGITIMSKAEKGNKSTLFNLLQKLVETKDNAYVSQIFDHLTKGAIGLENPDKADVTNHFQTLSQDENWAEYTGQTDPEGRTYDMSVCVVNGIYNMVVCYHGNVNEAYHKFLPQEARDNPTQKTAFAQQFCFNPKGDYCSTTSYVFYGISAAIGTGIVATLVNKALKESISAVATKIVANIRAGRAPNLTPEEEAAAQAEAEVTMELDMTAFEAALDEGLVSAIIGDFIAAGIIGIITFIVIALIVWLWHLIDKVYYLNHAVFNMSSISYQFFGPYTDNVADDPGQKPPMLDPGTVKDFSLPGAFTPPPIPSLTLSHARLADFQASSTELIHYGMFGVLNKNRFMEGVGYLFSLKDKNQSSSEPTISSKYEVHYGADNEQAVAIADSQVDDPSTLYDQIGEKSTLITVKNVGGKNKKVLQATNDIGHRSDNTFRVVTIIYDDDSF